MEQEWRHQWKFLNVDTWLSINKFQENCLHYSLLLDDQKILFACPFSKLLQSHILDWQMPFFASARSHRTILKVLIVSVILNIYHAFWLHVKHHCIRLCMCIDCCPHPIGRLFFHDFILVQNKSLGHNNIMPCLIAWC